MEIADVLKMLVAHGADAVVGFIHAIAGGEDVLALGGWLRAEDDLALHRLRHFAPAIDKHGGSEIEEANEIVAHAAGFKMARPADDQRNVNALVVYPALLRGRPRP